MTDWTDLRRQARRTVHAAFSVPAHLNRSPTPIALSVRWHDKFVKAIGDIGDGYAQVLENIDKVMFDEDELTTKGITLARGDVITLDEYDDFTLTLDTKEPSDGPLKVTWNIQRQKTP